MEAELVRFAGAELAAVRDGDRFFVAMRPIIDALGLDWPRQQQSIKDDPVLSSTVGVLPTVGADGKSREMLCLPLDYLNGWLFKINANRYKGERRELIIRYQKECYRVLAEHFGLSAKSHSLSPVRPEELVAPLLPLLLERGSERGGHRAAKIRFQLAQMARSLYLSGLDEHLHYVREVWELGQVKEEENYNVGFYPPRAYYSGQLHPATLARSLDEIVNKGKNPLAPGLPW